MSSSQSEMSVQDEAGIDGTFMPPFSKGEEEERDLQQS